MGEVLDQPRTATDAIDTKLDTAPSSPDSPTSEAQSDQTKPSRLALLSELYPDSHTVNFAQILLDAPWRVSENGVTQYYWELPANVDTARWRQQHDLICLTDADTSLTVSFDRRESGKNYADVQTMCVSLNGLEHFVSQKAGKKIDSGSEAEVGFVRSLRVSMKMFGIEAPMLPGDKDYDSEK